MADFSIYDKGPDWIGVDVPRYASYSWYRIYVRDDYGTVYHDKWYYHTDTLVSLQVKVSGLKPETEYVVNVAHASSENGSDSTWGTAQYVTTTSSGSSGSGKTVRVHLDFDTNIIYRIRAYWWDEYGEEQGQNFYEPGWIEVQQDSYIEVTKVVMNGGYESSFPVYCEDDAGRVYKVIDENGGLNESFLQVEYWDRTFRFYIGSGGGETPDYGSFVERTPYFDGLSYTPYISDGSNWYAYRTFIAE